MPLLLNVNELKSEMRLAEELLNGYTMLFPADWQLSAEDIDFIKDKAWTSHVAIKMPLLDMRVSFEQTTRDQNISKMVCKTIGQAFSDLTSEIIAGKEINEEEFLSLRIPVAKMATFLSANDIHSAMLISENNDEHVLSYHTANVFFLAMVLGGKLKGYIKDERKKCSTAKTVPNAESLTPLAMAAFFHDLSLINHQSLWSSKSYISKKDKASIAAHPELSVDMLKGMLGPMARQAVRCHHENYDGTGYPEKLEGEKINVYSRILRVADAYSAATSYRIYKKAKTPATALMEMTSGKEASHYDPVVLDALKSVINPYPIGARLRLKQGETVVVVGQNKNSPFHPKVILTFDTEGKLVSPKIMENPFFLSDKPEHTIASALCHQSHGSPSRSSDKLLELIY